MSNKTVLFVTYGGGHAQMVLPVVQWLVTHTDVRPQVLALTTGAAVFTQAGLPVLGFRDFLRDGDSAALAWGEKLIDGNSHPLIAREESVAYLGLSYVDLEARLGVEEAAEAYVRFGRQAFRPVGTLQRIIRCLQPALVVATSSPRGERAAIEAARLEGVSAVCLVDLFAVDEIAWVGQTGYADRVCVLNQAVADRFLAAGRQPEEIVVTGNPAFDELQAPEWIKKGQTLRAAQGWEGLQVVLWASQPEPAEHLSVPGRRGDPTLPGRILVALERWATGGPGRVLVVRPHPSEAVPATSSHSAIVTGGRDFELRSLLQACDGVVTMNSTVGLQAHLAGKEVIQVLGSMFDDSVPLAKFGMAEACADPQDLPAQLARWLSASRPAAAPGVDSVTDASATQAVAGVILGLLRG